MIEIFHAPRTRSNRAIWAAEELGVPYSVRPVAFGQTLPDEITTHNPSATVPLMIDGDVVLFESLVIMEYIAAKAGPTPLVPAPGDANYWVYRQMLVFGEATLAAPINAIVGAVFRGPPAAKDDFTLSIIRDSFRKRIGVVCNRLKEGPYIAGETFTLADISVTYGIDLALRTEPLGLKDLVPADAKDYMLRLREREAYRRMLAAR